MHTRAAQPFVKSFVFSFLLHAAAVGLIVWLAWQIAVPAVHIFEVPPGESVPAGASVDSGVTASSSNASGSGSVTFKPLPIPVPRVAPAPSVEPEAVEVATQVTRVLTPEPVVVAPRTSVAPITSTSSPTVARPPGPTTKTTTLAQHRKEHPLPATSSSKSAAPVASVAPSASVPNAPARIDVGSILAGGKTPGASVPSASGVGEVGAGERPGSGSSGTGGANGESDSFLARLSEKLREAHRKPEGMDDGLRAGVAFVLHESGTISDVRIAQSSGNEAFDASAVAAFKRVTALGRPPASLIGANVIVFRTTTD